MATHCVFIHRGYHEYFENVIAITKFYNPNNKIVLIGDETTEHLGEKYNIDFFFIKEFEEDIPYYHFSTNLELYEKFCFQRWFIIKNFMNKYSIFSILHSDSDNIICYDFSKLEYTNAITRNYEIADGVVPNILFIDQHTVNKVTSFYLSLYSLPILEFVKEICNFADQNNKDTIHYSDMFFLTQCYRTLKIQCDFLDETDSDIIFNTNIEFLKDLQLVDKVFYNNDSLVFNVHFAGLHKDEIKNWRVSLDI